MSENRMSNVIRFISGHGFMNRHHKTVIPTKQRHQDADADPRSKCRLCDLGPETPIHLATVCPRLAWTRNQLFSQSQIVGYICDRPPPWSKGLLDFIQNDLVQRGWIMDFLNFDQCGTLTCIDMLKKISKFTYFDQKQCFHAE